MENNMFLKLLILYSQMVEDISDCEIVDELHRLYSELLYDMLDNKDKINNLNFDIIKIKGNKVGFKVIPNNAVTAFWVSGIYIDSAQEILPFMKFNIEDREYWYDSKKKMLMFK